MANQVTLAYTAQVRGLTPAAMAALIDKTVVPFPVEEIAQFGLRVSSDNTVSGPPVVRTVVIQFQESAAADLALTLNQSGQINLATVAVHGMDYIRPPGVTITPDDKGARLKAFLDVRAVAVDAAGTGYTANADVQFLGGLPPRQALSVATPGCVRRVNIVDPGLGYPVGTTVSFQGGGPDGSTPAIAARGVVTRTNAGRITNVEITRMGEGYVKAPQVVFNTGGVVLRKAAKAFAIMAQGTPARAGAVVVGGGGDVVSVAVSRNGDGYVEVPTIRIEEAGGTGAILRARMGVGRVDIIARGKGLPATTTTAYVPFFKQAFPVTAAQAQMFFNFLKARLEQAGITPISAAAPVLA